LLKQIKVPLTQFCRIGNLKIKPSKNSYYVINYDNQHWVCFYVKNNIAVYCDSYGEPPDSKILSFFRKHKLNFNEKLNGDNQMKNDKKLQDYIKTIFKK
jgi:hypothetical protein